MHQYQVKIHYHHPVGDYFARDMWKWHEGVWGRGSVLLQARLFWS